MENFHVEVNSRGLWDIFNFYHCYFAVMLNTHDSVCNVVCLINNSSDSRVFVRQHTTITVIA